MGRDGGVGYGREWKNKRRGRDDGRGEMIRG